MPIIKDISPDELELGEILRIPSMFVEAKYKDKSNPTLVKSLANKLKLSKKNILPIIVKQIGEDDYEAIHNVLILEAAKFADIDFVWCIPVDNQMEAQILAETGEIFQISLLESSEGEIIEAISFAKDNEPALKKVDAVKVGKVINSARTPSWNDLKPLSKLKCGVGASLVPVLNKYFIFPAVVNPPARSIEPTKPLSIESMSVTALKALAKERDITGYSKMKKSELVKLLSE